MESQAPNSEMARPSSLETVELELALGMSNGDSPDFRERLRKAVESVGGVVLFQINSGEGDEARWEAAVAFGDDYEGQIAIVTAGAEELVRIELVSESDSPVALIAPAFAGLAAHWATAA